MQGSFADVAKLIAGVDADWLAEVLVRFSELVGAEDRSLAEDKRLAKLYERLNYAADILSKELPRFRPLLGDISVKYADVALDSLRAP